MNGSHDTNNSCVQMIHRFVKHPLVCTVLKGCCVNSETSVVSVSFCNQKDNMVQGPSYLPSEKMDYWAECIRLFLDCKLKKFPEIPLQLSSFSPFQRKVLYTAKNIEWGSTVSYSQLAQMAGFKTAVRAVASVMSSNPFALIIPCHRVIRKDGAIGGFLKQRNGSFAELKKCLLKRELDLPL